MDSDPLPSLSLLTSPLELLFALWIDPQVGIFAFLLLGLLFLSALLSGSEVAFFSLKAQDISQFSERTDTAAQRIISLLSTPERLLGTILIANNIVNVAIILLSDVLLRKLVGIHHCRSWAETILAWFPSFEGSVGFLAQTIHYTLTVVMVTFFLVLFGEVLPKIYSKIFNSNMAVRMSGALYFLSKVFSPMTKVMHGISSSIQSEGSSSGLGSRKEEIDRAIELTTNQNDDKSIRQKDIMKSLVNFNEVIVKEIMKSRMDIVSVDKSMDFDEVLAVVKSSGYSRIPVHEDELDEIVGILYVKDLLPYLNKDSEFDWQQIVRSEIFYTPETKRIHELLEEFRESRMHLAIVVDEYGGTSGLITLEDVLEEVIGDIKDEFDDDNKEVLYAKINDSQYIFEGKTLLKDVYRVMDLEPESLDHYKGESDSIAGLFVEIIGRIPRSKEVIRVGTILLTAYSVDSRRIKKVKITLR